MYALRTISRRSANAFTSQPARRTLTAYPALRAQNGYGDPKGDPKAENPQEQGTNPQVDKEHPGPPPPSSAGGSGGSGASKSSSGSQPAKNGARPAIHDEKQPNTSSQDVKKHNEELANRNEKTHEKDNGEKVDPKFWKGHAGDKEK